ncbi:MoaD/ThiS family protein [Spirulina major CS-329]|uniref:MoaD/ThiS family protein n=1 Tax=Spirulina TaxID=1154 RepID=UPI00232D4A6B|nr:MULTISPECIES: MoaD/ThiS family protein [Spirulina]MDB9493957.1 MoaD/ThiS family protein [Spirulina subsalsa CS-330]MDB9503716.1 MoaD/ThiS family protein [Spirulina major CS-329]
MIEVKIKLFAAYQEAYQQSEIRRTVPSDTPVLTILEQVIQEHPELEPWRSLTRFGVNYQFVPPETRLRDGDEVVLIPPVSGG